jgi:hypothetical protein
MSQYFKLVNYDKKEEVDLGEVGYGLIKMQEFVADDDFGRLLSFIMADGRVDGGAIRSSWAGDDIDLIGDYRSDASELPRLSHPDPWKARNAANYKNVTRQLIEEFNAYATFFSQPLVRYNPNTENWVQDPTSPNQRLAVPNGIAKPKEGYGYYPVGRAVVTDYDPALSRNKSRKSKTKREYPTRIISVGPNGRFPRLGPYEFITGAMPAFPGMPLVAVPIPSEMNLCPSCKGY